MDLGINIYLCSWDLMSSGKGGWRRSDVNDMDIGSRVKGIQQTCLFSDRENLLYLPSTQAFLSVDITWSPLFS